jgi:hypothetical protein
VLSAEVAVLVVTGIALFFVYARPSDRHGPVSWIGMWTGASGQLTAFASFISSPRDSPY